MSHNLSPADIATRAARAAEKAHDELANLLLRIRNESGVENLLHDEAVSNLYYQGAINSKSFTKKLTAAYCSQHKDLLYKFPGWQETVEKVQAAFRAAEEARENRKRALEASRAVRAEKAKEIKRVGVKLPLRATEESYRVLFAGIQNLMPNLTELYFHHIMWIKTKQAEEFAKRFNRPVQAPDKQSVRAEAKRSAADALAQFAAKLTQKIDTTKRTLQSVIRVECKAAGDPNGDSEIVVGFDIGADQCWITSTIVNRSKYNVLFNQWPTRRSY